MSKMSGLDFAVQGNCSSDDRFKRNWIAIAFHTKYNMTMT